MASRRPQYTNQAADAYEDSADGGQRWHQHRRYAEEQRYTEGQRYSEQQRYTEQQRYPTAPAMAGKRVDYDDPQLEGGMAGSSGSQYRRQQQQGVVIGGDGDDSSMDCFSVILIAMSYLLFLITSPITIWSSIKIVTEYERAVIFRLGRLRRGGAAGPGWFFVLPCVDSYMKVDLRSIAFDVPPQEILTKDSVTIAVDAVVYYRVSNPTVAVANVEDFAQNTRLLAATTLRNALGTRTLAEILSQREEVSAHMQETLDEATDPWGVKVERVEIKDVRLPMQLQRAMAAEAEAAREAKAKVIAAEGENRASRALKEAADVMADSPCALQLRYLQTLNTISAEKNSTIVFPLPMDIIGPMLNRS
ncbi:band 7 protein AGAP004871-like [Amphibalanus amphitrite]|uniref:band 7 protein AGAP004871-like n=1 Tax=Amphibalanus amphitrite TaxID=1232801 RepID=UPI001C909D26|nr:band 7 protein AGAP004871-like [Amphibalanus amphitrite]